MRLIALFITMICTLVFWPVMLLANTTTEETLRESARRENIWSLAWGGTWAASTVAQSAIMINTDDRDLRVNMAFGAAGSALGLIPTFIRRPYILRHKGEIDRRAGESERDYEARLQALMERDEADKNSRRGFWPHFANVAVNTGMGAGLAFGYKQWFPGLLNVAVGIPIGIAMIETQPRMPSLSKAKADELAWKFRPIFKGMGLGFGLVKRF